MALDAMAVSELRSEFPALRQMVCGRPMVYLDGPGGTQVHSSVIEAMQRYMREANSNLGGPFVTSRRTGETVVAAREAIADLLNAEEPDEIVFGPNMTSLTFSFSRAMGRLLSAGDEIVVTRLDHDANIAPWVALEEQGAVVRHVDFDPTDCTLDLDSLEAAISPGTRIVALGYASNAVGTVHDVRRVVELAHQVGAWVYLDAVHMCPHGPIDVQALGCDFLVCSVYKFFGPHVGALYGRYELLERIPAYKVRPASDEPPGSFETGTLSFECLAGTVAAVDYLASVGQRYGVEYAASHDRSIGRRLDLKAGMSAILEYERGLCAYLVSRLAEIPGLTIYGITDPTRFEMRVPTVSFTLVGMPAPLISERLGRNQILAWAGDFYAPAVTRRLGLDGSGGLLRVGLTHYNTKQEVDVLIDALSALAG